MTKQRCPVCKKYFELGVDGVQDRDGVQKCDRCARVVRDSQGYAWFPGELSAMFTRDGKIAARQRPS